MARIVEYGRYSEPNNLYRYHSYPAPVRPSYTPYSLTMRIVVCASLWKVNFNKAMDDPARKEDMRNLGSETTILELPGVETKTKLVAKERTVCSQNLLIRTRIFSDAMDR